MRAAFREEPERVFQDARSQIQAEDRLEKSEPSTQLLSAPLQNGLYGMWDRVECSTTLSVLTVQQSSSVQETNPHLGNTRPSWKGLSKINVIFIYEYFLTDVDIIKIIKLGALKLTGYL